MVVIKRQSREGREKTNFRATCITVVNVLTFSALVLFLVTHTGNTELEEQPNKLSSSSTSSLRLPTNPKQRQAARRWPALEEIYDGKHVLQNPQFLLDFAIIGFQKSGTTTLMKWLDAHPQVQMIQEEIYDLYNNRTGTLIWRLHTQLKPGFEYKRGYKSPIDIFNANAIHLMDEYFPKTRLIVALRHPVLYYQSFYNFRIQNLPGPNDPYPEPLEGIGDCTNDHLGVCTHGANFAEFMYRLGKTLSKFPTETEKEIIESNPKSAKKAWVTRNLVFVLEMSQFTDGDRTRKDRLREDLTAFLGLDGLLQEAPKEKPGKQWPKEVQAIKDSRKICICDEKYMPLRQELMKLSRRTSTWILESFVKSDDVYYSSPDFFEKSMIKWMDDPCETEDPCKEIRIIKSKLRNSQ